MKSSGILRKGEMSFAEVLQELRGVPSFPSTGGVGIFIGVVRTASLEGHKVTKLEVDAYEEKAESALSSICSELRRRKGIIDVRIYHFIGEFRPGDDLVYVLVAGAHRDDTFKVLKEAVERYKHEAPFFKKEYLVDKETGESLTRWVEEFSPE